MVRTNAYKLFMVLVLGLFVFFYAGYEFNRYAVEAGAASSFGAAPARADVIVVLTGGRGRVDEGLRLLRMGVAGTLILSGVNADADIDSIYMGRVEPKLRNRIILDKVSKSTYENAVEVKNIVGAKGFKSVALLTSWYHLKRAEYIFRTVMPADVRITAYWAMPPNPEEIIPWNFKSMAILTSEFVKYWWFAAGVRV